MTHARRTRTVRAAAPTPAHGAHAHTRRLVALLLACSAAAATAAAPLFAAGATTIATRATAGAAAATIATPPGWRSAAAAAAAAAADGRWAAWKAEHMQQFDGRSGEDDRRRRIFEQNHALVEVSGLPCNIRREGGQSLVIGGPSLAMFEGNACNPL